MYGANTISLHLLEGTNSWRCSSWLEFAYPFIHLTKTQRCKHGDVCSFNGHLVLASMSKPIFPHQVHIWKRWFCWVLDFNGLGQWSLPHALNRWRNNLIVESPTCENPWNSFINLQIVITLINKIPKPYKWTLPQSINK
jgi:hypothetical protein